MLDYAEQSRLARLATLDLIYKAQKSHIGSNFSCIDILTVLFAKSSFRPDLDKDDDRIIVGKGWVAASFYYFLAEYGFIPKEDLERFCVEGEQDYIGLLEPSVRGVLHATGSVGMGLPFGVGNALQKQIDGNTGRIFVLEGDGGIQTGLFWESALIAAHHRLDNLVCIIDRNRLQAMGMSESILNVEPLDQKLRAFGWCVAEIDGHDHDEIVKALDIRARYRPLAIIANTVKGKGVSFMEDRTEWHYKAPNDEEYEKAMKELCQTSEDRS